MAFFGKCLLHGTFDQAAGDRQSKCQKDVTTSELFLGQVEELSPGRHGQIHRRYRPACANKCGSMKMLA